MRASRLLLKFELGDWPVRLTSIAQLLIGLTALLGVLAWYTLAAPFLLGFLFVQGFLLVGAIAYVLAAIASQRTVFLERFTAGSVISHCNENHQVCLLYTSDAADE